MPKIITIMTGSVREGNASEVLLPLVQEELAKRDGIEVRVANLREMALPFVDTPVSPAMEGYEPNHQSVRDWRDQIAATDAFIMLTPEYNFQPSPVQMNAIDWVYKEWSGKPVAVLSYGWGGGLKAAVTLDALLKKVEAAPTGKAHPLFFTKELNIDGTPLDKAQVRAQINAAIDEVAN